MSVHKEPDIKEKKKKKSKKVPIILTTVLQRYYPNYIIVNFITLTFNS